MLTSDLSFDLTARRAAATPDALALEDLHDGTRYTYAELDAQAARFAALASVWGLAPGARVAWLGHSRAECFVMLFGCAKAGLVLVPLNWRLAGPELEPLLDDCAPDVLIYGHEFRELGLALCAGRSSMRGVLLGEPGTPDDYRTALAAVTPLAGSAPPRPADAPWYLLYTSGTTGRPKGVIQTFRMMLANYLSIGTSVGLSPEDTFLDVLPLFHTGGINLYASGVLLVGGTVLVQRHFEPAATLAVLAQRVTVFFGVPAIYQSLRAEPGYDPAALRRVRSWSSGGAALPVPVAEAYAADGIRIRTGMGMTETGPSVFLIDAETAARKPGAVGRPLLLAEVKVVDAEGNEQPAGTPGELWIRGPGNTPGYWNQPQATAAAFTADGWLRSGDVAVCDAEGHYTLVDRVKDMFISGGENVYPAEVERALLRHPAVLEVAVVGMADPRWGEVGRACLVVREAAEAPGDTEAWREWCRAHLAGYKIPREFLVLPALPRNALGKVVKAELRHVI